MEDGQPVDDVSRFTDYVRSGNHAFLASDDAELLIKTVEKLQTTLIGQRSEVVDCVNIKSLSEFASAFGKQCERLVATLGFRARWQYWSRHRRFGIANDLREAMNNFAAVEQQGYLTVNRIDGVIDMQKTMEIEGALRSVMQLQHDIAVVLCGSHDTINKIVGDSHRPFYLSFRVFRF